MALGFKCPLEDAVSLYRWYYTPQFFKLKSVLLRFGEKKGAIEGEAQRERERAIVSPSISPRQLRAGLELR